MTLLTSDLASIFPSISHIHEHRDCRDCKRIQAWLSGRARVAMRSRPNDAHHAGSWLADAFDWGAHTWPLYWCDLNLQQEIDCGAFASLFSYCLTITETPHNRVQVIFPVSPQERVQWSRTWWDASASTAWILDGYVYHESIITHSKNRESAFIDTTDMVEIEAQCDDPRYTPRFVRVTLDGWQPKRTHVWVAGRCLRVGTWQAWEKK